MRLLVVSDEEDPYLWSLTRENHPETDLILSCGDLESEYLQYLVTVFNCPLLYVHGNHDSHYEKRPPHGCVCIDNRVYRFKGLRILGFGGAYRYRDGQYLYTESEMQFRYLRTLRQIRRQKGIDILLTHAPARGMGDLPDPAHRGFHVFQKIIKQYRPMYHFFGHVHRAYDHEFSRSRAYACGTKAINACGKYWLEIPDDI